MVTGRTKGVTNRGAGNVVLVAAQRDDPDGNPTEEYLLVRSDQFGRLRMTSGDGATMVTGRTKGMTDRAIGNVVLVAAQRDDADGNPTDEYLILRADQFGRLRVVDAGVDISCSLSLAADLSVLDATITVVDWDTEVYDTDGMHDLVVNPSRITVQTAGKYLFWANCDWDPNSTGRREMTLFRDGATVEAGASQGSPGLVRAEFNVSKVVDMAVGDAIEVRVLQNSGDPLNLNGGAGGRAAFGAIKILG